jgi:hypothetical protein
MTFAHMGNQRGEEFRDRPRRERRDLVRDERGQWWQAVIYIRNGVVFAKAIAVKSRHAKSKSPRLRLSGGAA